MNVLHIIRKKTQLKASFINNQIISHILYKPFVVFRFDKMKQHDGGFAEMKEGVVPSLNLASRENKTSRFMFKLFKKIDKRMVGEIIRFTGQNNIRILHFHYGSDAGIYSPFLKMRTLPSVVSFYGYDCSGFPKRMLGLGELWLRKRVFRYADKVLAMSPDMKKDLLAAGCPEEKIIVHYYGTDVQKFRAISREYGEKPVLTLLILCSLVPQKGHLFLLKSLTRLINDKEIPPFCLRIVGTGELEDELKTYTSQHGLSEAVLFIGAIPYGKEEMMFEYSNADIFVHPSVTATNGDKEGIPGAVVEAMASGLPVISTQHAGIPYILEHERTGLLVEEHDTEALALAMKRLIADVQLRQNLGEAARKYAFSNLDLKEKEKELEKMYDSVIKEWSYNHYNPTALE